MESKKINQLATNVAPASTDLTIIGDPITGVSKKVTLLQIASLFAGSVSFYTNYAAFPLVGSVDTIYCAKDTNKLYLWNGAYVQTFPSQALLDTYQLRSEKGVSNGYASLDSSGKVPIAQLPSSIMEYKGMWSAAANSPTLANGTGDTGDVYICNAAGSVNFGAGEISFAVGDYVVYSGSIWQRSSGAVGTVTSVGLSTNGNSITIGSSPVTTSATITANFVGDSTQYINGAGNLITFPTLLSSDNLVKLVRNQSGATMTAGTIVYISGATGNKPLIAKALATGDSTSAQTYGLLQADIANNADGYVVVIGNVSSLNTSSLTEGQQLYLSGTTAGTYTTTKPYAPTHLVYIGIVLRSHPTQGIIGVKIQNGYEMDELHNVDAQSPSNNDILSYNTTTSLWEHKQIATALGYTPADDSLVVKLAGIQTITGAKTFSAATTFSSTTSHTGNATFGTGSPTAFDGTDGTLIIPKIRLYASSSPATKYNNIVSAATQNRDIVVPDASGTLALTSDIPSLSGYVPYSGATTNLDLGANALYTNNLTIRKSGTSSIINFPSSSGGNDPGYIQHQESPSDTAIMRFNVGDNDVINDYFVFGNEDPSGGAGFKERFKITASGIVNLGIWQGTAIADSYIASSTTWNNKLNLSGGTLTGPLIGTTASFVAPFTLNTIAFNAAWVGVGGFSAKLTSTTGQPYATYSFMNGNVGIGVTDAGVPLIIYKASGSNYLTIKGDNNASYDIAQQFTDGTNNVYSGMMRGTSGLTGAYSIKTGSSIQLNIESTGASTFTNTLRINGGTTTIYDNSTAILNLNTNPDGEQTTGWFSSSGGGTILASANSLYIKALSTTILSVLDYNNFGSGTANGTGGNVLISTSVAQGIDIGGVLSLGGWTTSTGSTSIFGRIAGRKENATSTNQAGYLAFETASASPNQSFERARITSTGNLGIGTKTYTTSTGYTGIGINNATNGGTLDLLLNDVKKGELYITSSSFNVYGFAGVGLNLTVDNSSKGLAIATTGAATFSSSVTATAITATGLLYGNGGESNTLYTGAFFWTPGSYNFFNQKTDHSLVIGTYNSNSPVAAITILQSGATTFASSLTMSAYSYASSAIQFTRASSDSVTPASGNGILVLAGGNSQVRMDSSNNFNIDMNNSGSPFTALKIQQNGNVVVVNSPNNTLSLALAYQGTIHGYIGASGSALYAYSNNGGYVYLSSSSTWIPASDIKRKRNFETYSLGLNAILGLKPKLYNMDFQKDGDNKQLGLVAQEVKEFIPLAFEQSEKFIGLNYNYIIVTMVNAIKELKAEIDTLKNK